MPIDVINAALRRHGSRVAVSDGAATLTYRELDELAESTARDLAHHLRAFEAPARVGIRAGNSAGYVVLYVALLRAGCVPFLLDRASGAQETAMIAEDCGLDLLFHEPATPAVGAPRGSWCGLVASVPEPRPDRPALHPQTRVCRFTSGSTGRPRCIEFTGGAVQRAAANWNTGTGLDGDDHIVCFASLSNGLAFNTSLLSAFLVGARLHLAHGLPTAGRVTRLLAATGATRLVAFPALYESLVRSAGRADGPAPFPALRMAISSAAPLDPETGRLFAARTGVPIRNYYGAAEAGPLTFAPDPAHDPGLGRPLPGVSLRAGHGPGEPGPVEVRSESMGTRYLNAPGLLESRLTDDGHYRTGDLGYLSAGSLVLTGRATQTINIGGRKVDAAEVVAALRTADGVRDAVVLQVTDRHGAAALGAVVAADGPLDPLALRRHVGERLAAHKVPTLLRLVPDLPSGSSGKPAMAELRRMFD